MYQNLYWDLLVRGLLYSPSKVWGLGVDECIAVSNNLTVSLLILPLFWVICDSSSADRRWEEDLRACSQLEWRHWKHFIRCSWPNKRAKKMTKSFEEFHVLLLQFKLKLFKKDLSLKVRGEESQELRKCEEQASHQLEH